MSDNKTKCDRPMTAVVPLHANPYSSVCCARGTRVILFGLRPAHRLVEVDLFRLLHILCRGFLL